MWRDIVHVEIQNYSHRHINAIIHLAGNGLEWKFTGFYGHPEVARIREAWSLLRYLSNMSPLPWLCLGDFNEIVSFSEQRGAVSKTRRQMEDFQIVLEECSLSDLGFKGRKFTWSNGQTVGYSTQERLDRAVVNFEWCLTFGGSEVQVLAKHNSDHNPLLLCIPPTGPMRRRGRPFRVEASWELHPDFKGEVRKIWKDKPCENNPLQGVHGKLNHCKKGILRWVKKNPFGIRGA